MTQKMMVKKHTMPTIYVGIDVGKTNYALTVHNEHREKIHVRKHMPSNPEQLYRHIESRFKNHRIHYGYEAGPTGFGLYDYLNSNHASCMVVSPNSIPTASKERVKNNRLDSEKLSLHMAGGTVHSICVPSDIYRELRHLVHARHTIRKEKQQAQQRIHAVLLHESLYAAIADTDGSKHWSLTYIQKLHTLPAREGARIRLRFLIDSLMHSREQLLAIHRELKAYITKHPEIKRTISNLMSIPGIGFVTATRLLAAVGDPSNIHNVEHLGAFAGLVPSEDSTGDTVRRGTITRMGDRVLRALLIEAAWTAQRKSTTLNQFYHRIYKKNHRAHAGKKAITAVARKLTVYASVVLKEQRPFEVR